MRLASLARKITVTPSQISSYLEESGVALLQGSNTKLSDDQIEQVLTHFNKELPEQKELVEPEVVEEITEQVLIEEQAEEPEVEAQEEEIQESEESPVVEETIVEEITAPEPEPTFVDPSYLSKKEEDDEELGITEKAALDENIEIIKPPKVKLQGLTVKGKIDLPEPKIKEEVEEETPKEEELIDPDKIIYTRGPKREKRKPRDQKKRRKDPNYNPLEAERKRKARMAEQEEEKRLKARKKAKAQHYKKTVVKKSVSKKPQTNLPADTPSPSVPVATKPSKRVEKKAPSKNIFGKFWRWMNT